MSVGWRSRSLPVHPRCASDHCRRQPQPISRSVTPWSISTMQRDMGGPKGSGALLSIKELCSEDNRREVDAGSASNIDDPERRDRVSQSL